MSVKSEQLKAWLMLLCGFACVSCAPVSEYLEESSIATSGDSTGFLCIEAKAHSQPNNYPLSKNQYKNTLEDLFGSEILKVVEDNLTVLSQDVHDEQTGKRTTSLSSDKIKVFYEIAKVVSEAVVADTKLRERYFGSCASNLTNITKDCLTSFLKGKATHILRRPLNASEVEFGHELYQAASTGAEKLSLPLSYLLQSPHFIWRIELGENSSTQDGRLRLTSFELASKLSYLLTESTPDEELIRLARSKEIYNPRIIKEQSLRLIRTPRGRKKTIDFIFNWSRSGKVSDLQSLPADFIKGVETNGLEDAMVNEAKAFTEHIIFEKNGNFRDLINSKSSFASHTGLAEIYGHAPYNGEKPLTLAGERKGLLLRAPFLTNTGTRTSIIHRGVDFQEAILCNHLPSPDDVDIDVDRSAGAFTDDEKLMNSNRVNVAHQTGSKTCQSCHSIINPTGFAFEIFDSLGRIREVEEVFDSADGKFVSSHHINAAGEVPVNPTDKISVNSALDLVNYVSRSQQGHACFVRKVYRAMHEDSEEAQDHCLLKSAFEKNYQDRPIIEVIAELATGPGLRFKAVKD